MAYSVKTSVGYIDDVCLGADAPTLAVIKRRRDWSKARWSSVEADAMCGLLRSLGFSDVAIEACFPESSYDDASIDVDDPLTTYRPKNCRFFGQPAAVM
jgi:hypothetical protein